MQQKSLAVTILIMFLLAATTATALEISSLDRVSVLMHREQVLSILGPPDETGVISMGLSAEIYKVKAIPGSDKGPLTAAACVYDDDTTLKAQAFMFEGSVARQSAERLKEIGFSLVESRGASFQLLGKDDDTGCPIVVIIFEQGKATTVMIFEKEFYDRIKK